MSGTGISRLEDHGQTSNLTPAELHALDVDTVSQIFGTTAGDPVAMQPGRAPGQEPGDPVPGQRPGDPVPAQRPGDPVPAQRPGDPVPATRPCADDSLGDPVACQGKPR